MGIIDRKTGGRPLKARMFEPTIFVYFLNYAELNLRDQSTI